VIQTKLITISQPNAVAIDCQLDSQPIGDQFFFITNGIIYGWQLKIFYHLHI
jgi:hypothetical protein